MEEKRNTKFGISKSGWLSFGLSVFVMACGFVAVLMNQSITWGQTLEKVDNHDKAITEIRKEMKSNTRQLRREIKESAKETQTIVKDQMQILIQTIKSQ